MDIRMPQLDGIAATRLLRAQPDPPAVIVLTTFDADELVLRALQAGAAGFLLKDTPPAEIVRAIELVHAGDGMLSPAVTRRLIALVAGDGERGERARARPRRGSAALSAREREVALAVGRGPLERRDRRRAAHERRDGQGARVAAAGQARASTTASRSRCSCRTPAAARAAERVACVVVPASSTLAAAGYSGTPLPENVVLQQGAGSRPACGRRASSWNVKSAACSATPPVSSGQLGAM